MVGLWSVVDNGGSSDSQVPDIPTMAMLQRPRGDASVLPREESRGQHTNKLSWSAQTTTKAEARLQRPISTIYQPAKGVWWRLAHRRYGTIREGEGTSALKIDLPGGGVTTEDIPNEPLNMAEKQRRKSHPAKYHMV
ncbi:hypothetical protein Bbelb_179560 [Branchiostoma belcheri]|nr:hypothetical protein Bbelb_179560 [Branchiostoma belcheri]